MVLSEILPISMKSYIDQGWMENIPLYSVLSYFKSNKDYYLRMRLVLDNPNAEMNFDYMEWCPKSIFDLKEDKH